MNPATPYPLSAVRALILHTHALSAANGAKPPATADNVYDLITRIGCVQIDALQMVHRSHYMILWSRLGNYDPAILDHLVYGHPDTADNDRRCFEYWYHAACILPYTEYATMMPTMAQLEKTPWTSLRRWLEDQPSSREIVAGVRQRITQEGGLRAADFKEKSRKSPGSWWNWKPSKMALEYLYDGGQLMVADRIKFQRVYNLPERVRPKGVNITPLTLAQAHRRRLETAVRVFGLCMPNQPADFSHMKRTPARTIIADLLADGTFQEVSAVLADGHSHTMLIHRDNLPLLTQAADGALPAQRTTFLNPFDNLWYARDRVEQVWQFKQVLEAYHPKGSYRWGYFCLPILHQGQLIGRFDPKLERKTGTLRLKSIHLEPGITPDEETVAAIAATMRDFLAFHQATNIIIEADKTAVNLAARLLAQMDS